jgi:hypothetical protein
VGSSSFLADHVGEETVNASSTHPATPKPSYSAPDAILRRKSLIRLDFCAGSVLTSAAGFQRNPGAYNYSR